MASTILVVDDEAKIREIIAPYLKQEGYRVITAETGKQALQSARTEKPDLVILDWNVPETNGIDVCRELRQNSTVGIIMLTAKADEIDKIVGLEVGADDYLTKPFSLRELSARIRSVLRRTSGGQSEQPSSYNGDGCLYPRPIAKSGRTATNSRSRRPSLSCS